MTQVHHYGTTNVCWNLVISVSYYLVTNMPKFSGLNQYNYIIVYVSTHMLQWFCWPGLDPANLHRTRSCISSQLEGLLNVGKSKMVITGIIQFWSLWHLILNQTSPGFFMWQWQEYTGIWNIQGFLRPPSE